MAGKPELQHLPRADAELFESEVRSSLIVRGSKDAKSLLARKLGPALRARVKLNGKWGLIDETGRFVVEPFCYEIREFSCGMAAFSNNPVQCSELPNQRAINDFACGPWMPLENPDFWPNEVSYWGFVDKQWNIVIPARFKRVRDFSEDLAGVVHNDRWGFLSKDGRFAIDPQFETAGDFFEGLCIAKLNGRYGLIDRSGEFVVKPSFDYLWDFSAGLARAWIDKMYSFIDRAGGIAIPLVFESADDFDNGAARVQLSGRSCLIDPKGSVIFTFAEDQEAAGQFERERVGCFFDDVALVSGRYCSLPSDSDELENSDPHTWNYGYYIDRAGKPIPMPEGFIGIGDFSEGLGLVGYPRSMHPAGGPAYKYGYINNRGEVKIEPQFYSATDFDEGAAKVFTEHGEWRLIDTSGKFQDSVGSGESLVRIQGYGLEFGFADPLGRVVVEPIYLPEDFQKAIARVYTTQGQWRSIHKLGVFVDTPESEGLYRSRHGDDAVQDILVRFKANGLYGFADQLGNLVIEPRFTWVDRFSNGMARFRAGDGTDRRWGFINSAGEVVILPQFEAAKSFEVIS